MNYIIVYYILNILYCFEISQNYFSNNITQQVQY